MVSVLKIDNVRMSILNTLIAKYHNIKVELVLGQNVADG